MNISINAHSSIKFTTDKIIYFDPYAITEESHDADIIFVSHSKDKLYRICITFNHLFYSTLSK